jgi:hypothetical protein
MPGNISSADRATAAVFIKTLLLFFVQVASPVMLSKEIVRLSQFDIEALALNSPSLQ